MMWEQRRGSGFERHFGRKISKVCMLRLNQVCFPSFGDWPTGGVVLLLERKEPSLKVSSSPIGTPQFTEHSISSDT